MDSDGGLPGDGDPEEEGGRGQVCSQVPWDCSLARGHTCFQKGREPGVDGDLPGREHLPGTEGKLELTDRNTDRQTNKAFTQLCISTGTILGLGYVTWGEDLTFNQGPESRKEHLEGLINDPCKEQICCLRPKHQDTM